MIEHELFDGTIVELPEGMSPDAVRRAIQNATQVRRAAMAATDPAPAPTVSPPAPTPAPVGTDTPAATTGASDTAPVTRDEALARLSRYGEGIAEDAEGNPITWEGARSPLAAPLARNPEEAFAMQGRVDPLSMAPVEGMPEFNPAVVPPRMVDDLGMGIQRAPATQKWAQIDPTASRADRQLQERGLRRRSINSERDGFRGWAYDNFSSHPTTVGFLAGSTYGLADELLGTVSPTVGASAQQEYFQNTQENPVRTGVGELMGGVAQYAATRKAPGINRVTDTLEQAVFGGSGPIRRAAGIGVGAGIGMAGGAFYDAATANPGQREEAALNPANRAVDAAMFGGIAVAPEIYGIGRRTINRARGIPEPEFPPGTNLPALYDQSALDDELALRNYLANSASSPDAVERLRVGDAALDLGVDLPAGMIDRPEAYAVAQSDLGLGSRGRIARAEERLTDQLGDRFASTVSQGNTVAPTSIGAAGERLRNSVLANVDNNISNISKEYDEFSGIMQGTHDLPPALGERLDEVFARRFEAGSESDEDTAFIGEVANLVRRNALPDDIDPADVTELPGVSWQGMRDARSMLKTQTSNFSKGQQLTPKQRHMMDMEEALTESMAQMVRANAPADYADQYVERFFDIDRRYAIAQETRRELADMFDGGATSVMNTIGKALKEGGQDAVTTVRTLRENATDTDWSNARSVLLHKMGSDDIGRFDPARFASQWGQISPEVRSEVFTPGHSRDLDAIAAISRRLQKSVGRPDPSLSNKSLFSGALGAAGLGTAGLAGPVGFGITALGAAYQMGRVFMARSLTNPYTASQARKLYDKLDNVAKAKTDSSRALSEMQAQRELQRFIQTTGTQSNVPIMPLPGRTTTKTDGGAPNVTGRVGD